MTAKIILTPFNTKNQSHKIIDSQKAITSFMDNP